MRWDASGPLNRARERRMFVQRAVRSQIVVIAGIGLQNPAEVRLTQGDHMVDAFASDRSDQSFGEAVLPKRAWSDWFVADAHGSQSMPDGNAIDLIQTSIMYLCSRSRACIMILPPTKRGRYTRRFLVIAWCL